MLLDAYMIAAADRDPFKEAVIREYQPNNGTFIDALKCAPLDIRLVIIGVQYGMPPLIDILPTIPLLESRRLV